MTPPRLNGMKFYTRVNLEGVPLVRFAHMAEREFERMPDGDLLFTDPAENRPNDMALCIRGLGRFKLSEYRWTYKTGCLAYEDFEVGVTPASRPQWYAHVDGRIIETTASCDYGPEQRLRVAESLVHKSAEARI